MPPENPRPALSAVASFRREAGGRLLQGAFEGLAWAGQRTPRARRELSALRIERDLPYVQRAGRALGLDVYIPPGRPLGVVLYLHGGGFRILSKDTHWIMGLLFARRGFLVFNVDYRLSPAHPYPAAMEDACSALVWVHENAHRWGGDPSRIVVAGESAGANLATSLTLATRYRRPEGFARDLYDTEILPRAVVAQCGILEVSDTARFGRRGVSTLVRDRIEEVEDAYLGGAERHELGGVELADPLRVLERGHAPDRPLPPFFASVGTADALLDDTRRLAAALGAMGVRCDAHYYPGQLHAFQALGITAAASDHWRKTYAFLDEVLGASPGAAQKATS